MKKNSPIELNEENILKIYNDCLVKENQPHLDHSSIVQTKIFSKDSCGVDSPEIFFNKLKLEEYSFSIEYLYGQLGLVHSKSPTLMPSTGFIDYNAQYWTKNNTTLMAFYYLGVANQTIMPFVLDPDSKQLLTDLISISPTLSPNDPNYRKKGGQEPADD